MDTIPWGLLKDVKKFANEKDKDVSVDTIPWGLLKEIIATGALIIASFSGYYSLGLT